MLKEAVNTLGLVLLAAACCLLPVLIIGGIGVLGGVVWRETTLVLVGVGALVLAIAGAATIVRRRSRNQ